MTPESGLMLTALLASILGNLCLSVIVVMLVRANAARSATVRRAPPTRRAKPSPRAERPHERPRRGAILELARGGMTPSAVARATGAAPGEIDLVLSLEKLRRGIDKSRSAA